LKKWQRENNWMNLGYGVGYDLPRSGCYATFAAREQNQPKASFKPGADVNRCDPTYIGSFSQRRVSEPSSLETLSYAAKKPDESAT
jgi:hypothetical protein